MLGRRAEPGSDQQGAQLGAVQGGGVRLVVQPGRRTCAAGECPEEFFVDRVLVEPGDGAPPPGDGGAGTPLGFQVPGEAFDAGPADGEQRQRLMPAPGGELAQV
jgi:hypothetical protein